MQNLRKNFMFDLDGTLLPMDLQKFIKLYLQAFCSKFADRVQLDPRLLVKAIWSGAAAMGENDGECLNRELFWREMNRVCGKDMRIYEAEFDEFYRNEFEAARVATKTNPVVGECIRRLKADGCRLIVATNPIFPKTAAYARIRWAGLDPKDFDHITVYDNCTASKPNLNYYHDICSFCGILPEESIMVGNDVDEDMCAARLGFDTFLVTDCLINRNEKSISRYNRGSFKDFYNWLIERGY